MEVITLSKEKIDVDESTISLVCFKNKKGIAVYNAKEKDSIFYHTFEVNEKITDIEKKLTAKLSPIGWVYGRYVMFNAFDDSDKKLLNRARDFARKNESLVFDEDGDFRDIECFENELIRWLENVEEV